MIQHPRTLYKLANFASFKGSWFRIPNQNWAKFTLNWFLYIYYSEKLKVCLYPDFTLA